jgi:hypothetical protein
VTRVTARSVEPEVSWLGPTEGRPRAHSPPVLICPRCEEEFRATGNIWFGAVRLDFDLPDDELETQVAEWLDRV